jgi:hypothetical protein
VREKLLTASELGELLGLSAIWPVSGCSRVATSAGERLALCAFGSVRLRRSSSRGTSTQGLRRRSDYGREERCRLGAGLRPGGVASLPSARCYQPAPVAILSANTAHWISNGPRMCRPPLTLPLVERSGMRRGLDRRRPVDISTRPRKVSREGRAARPAGGGERDITVSRGARPIYLFRSGGARA